jgi:hypothetical protein
MFEHMVLFEFLGSDNGTNFWGSQLYLKDFLGHHFVHNLKIFKISRAFESFYQKNLKDPPKSVETHGFIRFFGV